MIAEPQAKRIIDRIFKETALMIGSLVSIQEVNDEFVWRMMKNLQHLREQTIKRFEQETQSKSDANPPEPTLHPAIQHFLSQIGGNKDVR